jgi:hypothetical protein
MLIPYRIFGGLLNPVPYSSLFQILPEVRIRKMPGEGSNRPYTIGLSPTLRWIKRFQGFMTLYREP